MSYERLRPTFTFDADRLAQMKAVVPEAFADGAINWEVLRAALDDHIEDESADAEHFGLFWPGKRTVRRRTSEPSQGTLIPVPGEGVNEDTTRNIFIEADNLEALKLLQRAYTGRIKMIYIDPPYNTGNDFVYKDDFQESTTDYLTRTGQLDERGLLLTTNSRSSGRFHTNWLNMMYPRLQLARQLLTDNGVIFVSIDENEVAHLRLLLNEIFGAENFVAQITIVTNPKGRVLRSFFSPSHDYLLVYVKSDDVEDLSLSKTEAEIAQQYPLEDQGGKFRLLELRNTHRQFGKFNRPNLFYPLFVDPITEKVSLEAKDDYIKVEPYWDDGFEGCWTWDRRKVAKDNQLLTSRQSNGKWKIYRKAYAYDSTGAAATRKLQTVWTDSKYHTEKGQAAFDALIPGRVFQSPKPVELIKTLLQISTESSDIILDFFAGSGTTGQAVWEQNLEDGGNRQFILIQFPEPVPPHSEAEKAGFQKIPDITRERLKRANEKVNVERSTELLGDEISSELIGFRTFSYAATCFREPLEYIGEDIEQLELLFDQYVTSLKDSWQPVNLLTEIMLLQGFPLDSRIERLKRFVENTVQRVFSDFHAHSLYVCLDTTIADETITTLALGAEDIFVCLDSALTDESKARLSDTCNLRTI